MRLGRATYLRRASTWPKRPGVVPSVSDEVADTDAAVTAAVAEAVLLVVVVAVGGGRGGGTETQYADGTLRPTACSVPAPCGPIVALKQKIRGKFALMQYKKRSSRMS